MTEFNPYRTPSGQSLTLRRLRAEDAPLLIDFFDRLSAETKRLRFHTQVEHPPRDLVWREAQRLSNLDPEQQVALVATIRQAGAKHIAGVARFERLAHDDHQAELAIVIRDDYQGQGLGEHLLKLLKAEARRLGLTHFYSLITSDNPRMLKLIKKISLVVAAHTEAGQSELKTKIA